MVAMLSREKSRLIFVEAQTLMPGGVNSPARSFGAVGGNPIVIARGEGAYLYDVDGNKYLDYVQSWGPMILGHAHPAVVLAIKAAVNDGTSFGAPTETENEFAKLLIEQVPALEKIRFVNSGTEATMSAIRLARGYTGRNKIVKFIGNYHGHVDSLLVAAGSAAATLGVPDSPGVPPGAVQDTILLPYNCVDAVRKVFQECASEIAGVIVEPVAGNMGCVIGSSNFLYELRHLTQDNGAILIFDEVLSGFRAGKAGAGQRFSITPDLITLGKVIGGGLPVGAYGGKAEIMDHILPVGKIFQAGTLSGNPLAMVAGMATVKTLRDKYSFNTLERKTALLAEGLEDTANAANIPVHVEQIGSMMTLFFTNSDSSGIHRHVMDVTVSGGQVTRSTATSSSGNSFSGAITDWASASTCNTERYAKYFWGMLERGYYFPCSQFEAFFMSTEITEAEIEQTIAAAAEVFQTLDAG